MNETVRSLEAYHNGNYFVLNEENGVEQKLFSPLTVEEALDYRADNNMDTADFLQDCTEQAFVKKEDGSWELTYSGYTKNAIATLEEDMGLSDDMLGAGIVDMKVTFTADEKYYAKQIKLEFVFEDEKNAPVVSITMEYSKYNEAKRNTAELNVADYTQVADIRLLTDIEDMIEERGESTDASFVLELTQTVKGASGQQLSSYTEKDEVSFGEDEGGYFYDIDATIAGAKYDISYKNGKQTIKVGSQSETAAQTEQEARAYIEALINSAYYAPSIVSNIESKGDGVYKITCGNPDTAAYESAFTSMGGTFTSATQTITVTIENEQIVKIESTALAKGTVTSYGTISLLLETTVTFD